MTHPDRKAAKRFDIPGRSADFTDIVYSGTEGSGEKLQAVQKSFLPDKPKYRLFHGELHGHTDLSDGGVSIDTYFTKLRDEAKVDFCAVTDHDHGGVGKPELWDAGKWDLTRRKIKEYYVPGRFTTILAYSRKAHLGRSHLLSRGYHLLAESRNAERTQRTRVPRAGRRSRDMKKEVRL